MLAKGLLPRADKYPINIKQHKKKLQHMLKETSSFRIVVLYHQNILLKANDTIIIFTRKILIVPITFFPFFRISSSYAKYKEISIFP